MARRLVSGLPLKMPSHKVFHARHFYQRMIKASIRLPIHVQMLVLADEIGLGKLLKLPLCSQDYQVIRSWRPRGELACQR